MTRRFYANAAPQVTLQSTITSGATSATISGTFAGWPVQFPFFACFEYGTASMEIVSVTNIVGSVATIVRGQDGTSAIGHNAGATLDQVVVRQDLDEANAHIQTTTAVHGTVGAVVGTTDAQTLTNKTLTSPAVNTPAVASPTVTGTVTNSATNNLTKAGTALAVTNNATVGGTLGVTGTATVGALSTAGAVTATGAVSGASVAGIVQPKSFTNEAAAGTPTAGNIVYLTAPTQTGVSAGLFRGNGTIWVPESIPDAANAVQALLFTPAGNTDTPLAGTATWATLGNVTVPAWATRCAVTLTMNGIYDTGTTSNVTVQVKVGAGAGGVNKRLLSPGVAAQRFHQPITDIVTGLSAGSQSVTLAGTFTAGTVVRADTSSFFTALFTFLP